MKEDTITHSRAIVTAAITSFIYFLFNGDSLKKALLNMVFFSVFYGIILIFVSTGSN